MSQDFVELNRTFWPAEPDINGNPEDIKAQSSLAGTGTVGWWQLFEKWRVVVLAEPGTGKTEEFKAAALKRQAQGNVAFFCRIELLSTLDITATFDIGDRQEFENWLSNDQEAWFFLDSVDEARLADHRAFDLALRKFANSIEGAKNRAHIFISCRVSDWKATADKSLVTQLFSVPQHPERLTTSIHLTPSKQDIIDPVLNSSAMSEAEEKSEYDVAVYQLAPLNYHQIIAFAEAKGTSESSAFIQAIERIHGWIFAERPQDLLDLIVYWHAKGQFQTHEVMLAFNISQKLRENNPTHDEQNPFSEADAHRGAEGLAAAVTFKRTSNILLPDQPSNPNLRADSIAPERVLRRWDRGQLNALLNRPIFDEALYGAVRFHHRSAREYLTAKWLKRLLDEGRSRRSIESLVFTYQYGCHVVIPSMAPIAAWLALWDTQICNSLCDIAPEVLLTNGDPASLSIEIKKKLLISFAEQYTERNYTGVYVDGIMIQRLASPELAETVTDLLQRYSYHDDIRELLLKLALSGRMATAVEAIIPLAIDDDIKMSTRNYATRAIVVLGSSAQQQQLVESLCSDLAQGSLKTSLAAELLALYPTILTTESLLELFEKVKAPRFFRTDPLIKNLESFIDAETNLDRCRILLTGLSNLLQTEPFIESKFCRISEQYFWLLPYAIQCANKWIEQQDPHILQPTVFELVLGYLSDEFYDSSNLNIKKTLLDKAKQWSKFRHCLFWYTVDRERVLSDGKESSVTMWYQVDYALNKFWHPEQIDLESLFNVVTNQELLDNQHIALSAIWQVYIDQQRPRKLRERLKKSVSGNESLQKRLHEFLHPSSTPERKKRLADRRNRKRRRLRLEQKQARIKQQWHEAIIAKIHDLCNIEGAEEGKVSQEIVYLYQKLAENDQKGSGKWGLSAWEKLIPEFGLHTAEVFRDVCQAYWRRYDPFSFKDWQTQSSVPYARVIGLTGLAIETQDKTIWAQHLNTTESTYAAKYSILELNELPYWFADLQQHFPEQVDPLVKEAISLEVKANDKKSSLNILQKLKYTDKTLQSYYQPYIFNILSDISPQQYDPIHNALEIILSNAEEATFKEQFSQLALQQFNQTMETPIKTLWLSALMHIDASVGLSVLSNWIASLPSEIAKDQTVIQFCANLTIHRNPHFGISKPDFFRVEILQELIPLIYQHVRFEDDIQHEGVYSPDMRDNAQSTRSLLLSAITNTPGQSSYEALLRFSNILEDGHAKDYLLRQAEERAALDSEFSPWNDADVADFQEDAERTPHSEQDLFGIALSRLDDLKNNIENGDTSDAAILVTIDDEVMIRNTFANRLEQASRARYRIAQEEEFPDKKRTDIRFTHPQISEAIPVELKIAHKWSYSQLLERLENQLIGQYMRQSHVGVFLIAHNGNKRYWQDTLKRRLSFTQLIEQLNQEADTLVTKYPHATDVKVIGIDFTIRNQRQVNSR
ncbi:hypothetical protein Lepto7375DRAFT_0760 [Leptolyngbya sp. PCC 7375]|nr:hypothetical protein Lepto7375DRAFT_0760 [Leptolyngbya sp. PCC 7375]